MVDNKIRLLVNAIGGERFKFDELLSYHTFNKIGGPAECFYIATTTYELINILNCANQLKIPFFILGGGTKAMISTTGLTGLTIKNRTNHIKISGIKGKVGKSGLGVDEALVEADSGITIGKLNEFLISRHLKPINGSSSSHSSVGGALFFDPDLRELTQKVKVWQKGEVLEIDIGQIEHPRQVVLSVIFKIRADD